MDNQKNIYRLKSIGLVNSAILIELLEKYNNIQEFNEDLIKLINHQLLVKKMNIRKNGRSIKK